MRRLTPLALLLLTGCGLFGGADGSRALEQAAVVLRDGSPFACFALRDEGSVEACLVAAEEAELAPCRAMLNACAMVPEAEADACIDEAEACGEAVGQRYDRAWLALTGSSER